MMMSSTVATVAPSPLSPPLPPPPSSSRSMQAPVAHHHHHHRHGLPLPIPMSLLSSPSPPISSPAPLHPSVPSRRPLPTPGFPIKLPPHPPAAAAAAAATAAAIVFRSPLPTPEPPSVSPPPRLPSQVQAQVLQQQQPISPQTPSASSPNRRPLPNPARPCPSSTHNREPSPTNSSTIVVTDSRPTSPSKFLPYYSKRTLPPLNTVAALDSPSPSTAGTASDSSHSHSLVHSYESVSSQAQLPQPPQPHSQHSQQQQQLLLQQQQQQQRSRGKSVSTAAGRPLPLPSSPTQPPPDFVLASAPVSGAVPPTVAAAPIPRVTPISVPRGWKENAPVSSPPRLPSGLPHQPSSSDTVTAGAAGTGAGMGMGGRDRERARPPSPKYGIRQLPARSRSIVDDNRRALPDPLALPAAPLSAVAAASAIVATTPAGARATRSATIPRQPPPPLQVHHHPGHALPRHGHQHPQTQTQQITSQLHQGQQQVHQGQQLYQPPQSQSQAGAAPPLPNPPRTHRASHSVNTLRVATGAASATSPASAPGSPASVVILPAPRAPVAKPAIAPAHALLRAHGHEYGVELDRTNGVNGGHGANSTNGVHGAGPTYGMNGTHDPLDDSPPASPLARARRGLRTDRTPSPVSPIRFAERSRSRSRSAAAKSRSGMQSRAGTQPRSALPSPSPERSRSRSRSESRSRSRSRSRSSSPVSPIRFARHSPDVPPYRMNPYAIVPPRLMKGGVGIGGAGGGIGGVGGIRAAGGYGGLQRYGGSVSNPASPTRRDAPLPPPPAPAPAPAPPPVSRIERGRTVVGDSRGRTMGPGGGDVRGRAMGKAVVPPSSTDARTIFGRDNRHAAAHWASTTPAISATTATATAPTATAVAATASMQRANASPSPRTSPSPGRRRRGGGDELEMSSAEIAGSAPGPPSLPQINIPGGGGGDGSGSIPQIALPGQPSITQISVSGQSSLPQINAPPSLPQINVPPSLPQINVSGQPPLPKISIPSDATGPTIVAGNGSRHLNGGASKFASNGHVLGSKGSNKLACGGCGGPIVGRIVSAMGARWHPSCFRCCECGELLEYVSSYESEGRPYCHLDYHEKFAPRCFHCKTAIVDERFITLDDAELGTRTYHEQHFFCAECGDPFLAPTIPKLAHQQHGGGERTFRGDGDFGDDGDVPFTVFHGHPYCEPCHVRLRSPRCKRCQRPIHDGTQAVEALGGKWHWECFTCTSCDKPFNDPSFFLRGEKPFCEPCFSTIVKNEL